MGIAPKKRLLHYSNYSYSGLIPNERALRKTIFLFLIKSANVAKGAFVWDQSGIRKIGIMQVSVCLGAILIPEYLDSILAILLPGAE